MSVVKEKSVQKKVIYYLFFIGLSLMIAGCGRKSNVCATEPPNQPIEIRQQINQPQGEENSYPIEITIRKKTVMVDKIVHGNLCDAQWSGTIYVDCDVKVPDWEPDEEGEAKFFSECNLEIEEGTLVYVGYHNDEAYYKGCSCHTSD
jgi:hypothetical protein